MLNFVSLKNKHKYFFAFIVTIYLVTNIGVPVYLHYCGGELETISTLFRSTNCCGEEEDDSESDCCKNETIVVSQKTEANLNGKIECKCPVVNDLLIKAISHDLLAIRTESSINKQSYYSHPPEPEISKPGRLILNQKNTLII